MMFLRPSSFVWLLMLVGFGSADEQVCNPVVNQWTDCINLFPSCADGCIDALNSGQDRLESGVSTSTCTGARSVACTALTCCSFCLSEASAVFDCVVEPLNDPSCTLQQCPTSTSGSGSTGSGSTGNGSTGSTTSGSGYVHRSSIGLASGIMGLSLWMIF